MVTAAQADRTVRGVRRYCAEAPAEQDLLRGVGDRIRPIVPWEVGAWLVTDPTTQLPTDGWVVGFHTESCAPWFHNELWVDDLHKFTTLAGQGPATMSSVDDEAKQASERWSQIMRPQGLDDELRFTLDDATGCWGTVELHRRVGDPSFSPDEVRLIADLAPIVAGGLRRLALERAARQTPGTDGPGLVRVDRDGQAHPLTDAGRAWLELLVPANPDHHHTSFHALGALVASPGTPDRNRRIRVRAADGRWVTLHASSMLDDDSVAVIVEPSRPADLAGVIARAYGLTPREQEVVLAIARGASTSQMAASFFLSTHTIRDHVKACFAKVGVSSRTELVAALFDDHHAADFFAKVAES